MNNLEESIQIVKNGGVLIFPTDTVMGIGCRIDDEEAIKRIFEIKKRSPEQAVPVLVSSIKMAEKYAINIPEEVKEKLMNKYWPGGLTIILHANKENVFSLLRGGGGTIALRIPNKQEIRELIDSVGVPIIGTSANFHGEKTPTSQKELNPELLSLVDGVLEGDSLGNSSSTIIDCTVTPWKIVREGAVKVEI